MSIKKEIHKNLRVGNLVKLVLQDQFGETYQPVGYISKIFDDIISLSQLPKTQGNKGNKMSLYNPSKNYWLRDDAEFRIIKYQKLNGRKKN